MILFADCRTAEDAKQEIESFMSWVVVELQLIDSEITQRINAEFAGNILHTTDFNKMLIYGVASIPRHTRQNN